MAGLGSSEIRVGTPDPTQYHDPAAVRTEGADRSLASLVPGGRGVIIPRATEDGASRGYDHNAPQKVIVHTGDGKVVVDTATLQANAGLVQQAMRQNMASCGSLKEAAAATYAQFAEGFGQAGHEVTVRPGQSQRSLVGQMREAPLQMPGTYVVPAATAGGGQVQVQPAAPRGGVPVGPLAMPGQPAPRQSGRPSLHDTLTQPPQPARVPRRVMFEIPRAGQITTYYHDVVRADGTLVLVYDHSQAGYPHYVPPVLEGEDQEPEPLAVAVYGDGKEPSRLYLVYYTGLHFVFQSQEFFVLVVEKTQPMPDDSVR